MPAIPAIGGFLLGAGASAAAATVVGSMVVGAAVGGITSAIKGGNILKGMVFGGATGFIGGAVGAAATGASTAAGSYAESVAAAATETAGASAPLGSSTLGTELGASLTPTTVTATEGLMSSGNFSLMGGEVGAGASELAGSGAFSVGGDVVSNAAAGLGASSSAAQQGIFDRISLQGPSPIGQPTVGQNTNIQGGGNAPQATPNQVASAPVQTPTGGTPTPDQGGLLSTLKDYLPKTAEGRQFLGNVVIDSGKAMLSAKEQEELMKMKAELAGPSIGAIGLKGPIMPRAPRPMPTGKFLKQTR